MFGQSIDVDVLTTGTLTIGTLTITSFSDAGIEGRLDATGTGATTSASSTFTASRCEI